MKKSYVLSFLLLGSMFSAFTVHANSEIDYKDLQFDITGHYKCENIKKDIVSFESDRYYRSPKLCAEGFIPKILEVKVESETYARKYRNEWGNVVEAQTRCVTIVRHSCLTKEEYLEQKEN